MYKFNNYLLRVLFLAIAPAFFAPAQAEKLVLLHTNDTHSQMDPAKDDGLGGVARRKVLIDSVRAAQDNVVLIDAGDIVQGTLFFNLYKGKVEEKMMNELGYDLRILGNHEFDNGMQVLADNLAMADATLLASNYNTRNTPLEGVFKPYEIKEFDGKRIAFMPVNLRPEGMILASNVEGMHYVDAKKAANNLAWYLKNIEGADYVVAITHIGYDDDVELIKSSHDIDLLIGGHSHTVLDPSNPKSSPYIIKNADGKDIIVAQTGNMGRRLGEITIDLDSLQALPQYRLITVDKRLDSQVDPAIEEILSPYRADMDALNKKTITKATRFMPRSGAEQVNFVSDVILKEGNKIAGNVDLAIYNKGGLRNAIEKGDISEGEIITLMPFFNKIQVIEITGDSLLVAFDTMAAADGNGVSGNVSAKYNPDTDKCTEVLISGKPIDPNRTYRIATIDYLAAGGDYMHSLVDHKLVGESKNLLFEDVINYFKADKKRKFESSTSPRMQAVK